MRHLITMLMSLTVLFVSSLVFAGGDVDNGKKIALEKGCAGCHGVDGNSPVPAFPKIAGQGAKYLARQLYAFRDNDLEKLGRVNPQMSSFASGLSDQDIDDLSAYFASQKANIGEAKADTAELGYQIYRGGDKSRGIPSCMGCHGPTGAGNPTSGYPALAGQWLAYTESQLKLYKAEERRTDPNRMMRDIATKMTPEEITAVANAIQGLRN